MVKIDLSELSFGRTDFFMTTDSSVTIEVRNSALPLSENRRLLKWVEKMAGLTKPAAVHWVDGSQEDSTTTCRGSWSTND